MAKPKKTVLMRKGRGKIHKRGNNGSKCGSVVFFDYKYGSKKDAYKNVSEDEAPEKDRCTACFREPVGRLVKTHIRGTQTNYWGRKNVPLCGSLSYDPIFSKAKKDATCALCRKAAKLPPLRTDRDRVAEARKYIKERLKAESVPSKGLSEELGFVMEILA